MEKKLTIAHIAPYLPYGLEVKGYPYSGLPDEERQQHPVLGKMMGLDTSNAIVWFKDANGYYWDTTKKVTLFCFKPILRPLSQLTQEIEHNGERFVPVDRLEYTYSTLGVRATIEQLSKDNRWVNHCEYLLIQHLLEWHFDINNLLSDGLAIEKGAEG